MKNKSLLMHLLPKNSCLNLKIIPIEEKHFLNLANLFIWDSRPQRSQAQCMNHTLLGNINMNKLQSCSHTHTQKTLKFNGDHLNFRQELPILSGNQAKVCPTVLKFYIFSKDRRCVLLLFFTKLNVRQILANVTC